jgi:hypothetical protein
VTIPPFEEGGNLPPGIHDATWEEIVDRFGNTARREELLAGLQEALLTLRDAGCRRAYLDGSFVTTKEEPGDFDACWEVTDVDAGQLDPVLLTFTDARRAQKERFGGELFPAEAAAEPHGTRFLEYFQRDKITGDPKGIVALDLETLP